MINCPGLNELIEPLLQKEHEQTLDEHMKKMIRKKLLKNKSPEVIAAELEEDDIDKIRRLIDEISKEETSATNSAN